MGKSKRIEAIASQDPKRYLEACSEEGIDTDEDPFLAERAEAERVFKERYMDIEVTYERIPKTKMDYKKFGEAIERNRYQIYDIFSQTEDKRRLLEECGRTHVKHGGGRISIRKARPAQVGSVALHEYEVYLKKYKNQ